MIVFSVGGFVLAFFYPTVVPLFCEGLDVVGKLVRQRQIDNVYPRNITSYPLMIANYPQISRWSVGVCIKTTSVGCILPSKTNSAYLGVEN